MCSNPAQRIAEIGQAIDDLAAEALAAYAPASRRSQVSVSARPRKPESAGPGEPGAGEASVSQAGASEISDTDQVVIRLARLWALLAEMDPEVARRLPTYEA